MQRDRREAKSNSHAGDCVENLVAASLSTDPEVSPQLGLVDPDLPTMSVGVGKPQGRWTIAHARGSFETKRSTAIANLRFRDSADRGRHRTIRWLDERHDRTSLTKASLS